jgi:hypothetical protein
MLRHLIHSLLINENPNTTNHRPAGLIALDDIPSVAGRVQAVDVHVVGENTLSAKGFEPFIQFTRPQRTFRREELADHAQALQPRFSRVLIVSAQAMNLDVLAPSPGNAVVVV